MTAGRARALALFPILFVVVFLLVPPASLVGVLAKDPLGGLGWLLNAKIPPDGEVFRVYEVRGTRIVSFTGLDFGPVLNTLLLASTVSLTATLLGLFSAVSCLGLRGRPRLLVGYALPLLASLPTPFISAYAMTHLFHREFGLLNVVLERLLGFRVALEGIIGVLVYQLLSFLPLSHLIVMSYIDLVDRSLIEAASNLGARGLEVLRSIVVPLARPALVVSGTLTFVLSAEDLSGPAAFSRYNSARNLMAYVAYYDFVSEYGFTVSLRSVAYVLALSLAASAVFAALWRNLRTYRYPVVSTKAVYVEAGIPGLIMAAAATALLAFSLLPKALVLAYSVTEGWYGYYLPRGLTLGNYLAVLATPYYSRALANTVVYSVLSVLLVMLVSSLAAYASLRLSSRLSPVVEALTALPLVIPGIAVGIGYFSVFHEVCKSVPPLDPMVNPAPYLVLAYAARRLTYAARPLSAALQKVPKDVEEQALNLGAGHALVLRTVTLPLVSSAFLVAAALASLHTSTEFSVSLVLAGGYGVSASHPAPAIPVIVNMLTYNPASIHVASALLVLSSAISVASSVVLAAAVLRLLRA